MPLDKIQLRNDLCTDFTPAELTVVARRFGVEYTALGGRTTADRSASLIGLLERQGRLHELVRELIRERPHRAAAYEAVLPQNAASSTAQEDLLRRLAAGEGDVIEESPTMRWQTDHPE